MTWMTVESKMFTAVACDDADRSLYLRFSSGDVYRYFEVPGKVCQAFLEADSKGRFFLAHIRDRFRYRRLARLRAS